MKLPDIARLTPRLQQQLTRPSAPPEGLRYRGPIVEIGPTLLRASLPNVAQGELCRIEPQGMLAEVVSIEQEMALLSPFASSDGLRCGQWVTPLGHMHRVQVGADLAGRILDGLGAPIDGGPPLTGQWRELDCPPPSPLTRQPVEQMLTTGIRAIDGILSCGEGQRIGIFAAAGVGKSTLLSMLCADSAADVMVLALIGERGREVREFLEQVLTPEARARTVVVVATSDRPVLERLKGLSTATTVAEYFRERGLKVLLLADSLTRYARAAREIGLAAGEPPAAGSFPPSVFANLPRLLERTGNSDRGSITAFYTVLVEGDDMNEPVADEVRSLLDGHIVLSRRLAGAGHYPAIDIAASVSRIMPQIVSAGQLAMAQKLRRMLACYQEIELLVQIGEYQAGEDLQADEALQRYPAICAFLQQDHSLTRDPDTAHLDTTLEHLAQVVG
ncbi:EscN/YscN/HrcN family type III secretion system ATPase [Yersinia pseudotuberculosis]|uniref:EscN/YscN/HrcN family type III secretion system ATPase n=1 Tax=Yersinia pseudotuberculosis TaxID=633 RepID=UPI0005DF1742|nr:EscN/YscN/HrcN family type III secretion system ATPase [Yersinia pseudotuberculosis]AXY36110.1 EscN/YscN/HrcN family type III secretion system ATPase [Yersinia pseudotuberculosis]AYX10505.1 EscN/YscN/HrcN family type III secretion system ATPase [Yersinia pseudotuberculosis]MBO1566954.1 EscN/YscN/HrcN family type III secretion system ATPase [Yersinia pseudotuberculosis]MBO1590366.1 EscN/YscN/HrcN family type III secretion system ATPase [Yersinia pseudotuberculosis]MBO1603813.1 EscN/YscN/HrcN